MPEYTFAPAMERADIDDYVGLFQASFAGDNKLNSAYLNWQYIANPHGRVIGFDAFIGDMLVAHYAIIPRHYRLGNQNFDAALSVNTATHPGHQGKGLFVKLAEATYRAAAQQGVKFVVGAANANSVRGFTGKLGFTELGQIRLHAGFKAPSQPGDFLDVGVTADWLDWRLANPARQYALVPHSDGSTTLRCWVKHMPFNIARVQSSLLAQSRAADCTPCGTALLPGLAPYFASTQPLRLRLPAWAQPSPWHVIWRALDPACGPSLAARIRFDGISMDTF